jgi:TrmH family RNA methyltransferase
MAGLITSPANPRLKALRALRARKHRTAQGASFAEGIHVVLQALEHDAPVRALVVAPELLTSDVGRAAVERFESAGGEVLRLSAAAFASVSGRDNPTGLGAVVELVHHSLADLEPARAAPVAWLHEVASPGNLGAVVRTADALGCAGVIVSGASADPYDPAAVKASMGALFARPVVVVPDEQEVLGWCARRGIAVVATSAHAPTELGALPTPEPCTVLFGSEAHGLPRHLLAGADLALRIPMRGSVSSLNLAVAAGIVLYELSAGMTSEMNASSRARPSEGQDTTR